MTEKRPWKSQKKSYEEALKYLSGRQKGIYTSLKTPWNSVNDNTLNGFEWQSTIVIGGRPGTGKTAIKDQLIREAFKLNPASNMRVLEFSLEMVGKTSAIRGFSAHVGKSYKYLCSADGSISNEHLQMCLEYSKEMVKYNIDIVEEAPTVSEFEKAIDLYMEDYAILIEGKDGKKVKKYQNTVITIDHSLLLRNSSGQTRNDMLYELGMTVTKIKRKYPVIFIILSQLNRSIDHPERNEDGKYGNYVLESDIFGADALLQHADMVIGLNRPGKQKIRFYGPERYIVPDEQFLVMHFLKSRNGVGGLAFFSTRFEEMKILEIPEPAKYETRASKM